MSERERIGHGLGRKKSIDRRDNNYPIRALLPRKIELTKKFWWAGGAWYDQGSSGTCVGHGWAHFAEDSPITHPNEKIDPYDIYRRAVKLDPWPQNDGPDYDYGTTVRAAAQAMQQMNFIREYRWAFSVQEVRDTLLTIGPMVIGVDWFNSMFNPVWGLDSAGIRRAFLDVDPRSGLVGGHCVLIDGVHVPGKSFRIKNSWGRSWGSNGFAAISFDDLGFLLSRDGEACIASEVRRGT